MSINDLNEQAERFLVEQNLHELDGMTQRIMVLQAKINNGYFDNTLLYVTLKILEQACSGLLDALHRIPYEL